MIRTQLTQMDVAVAKLIQDTPVMELHQFARKKQQLKTKELAWEWTHYSIWSTCSSSSKPIKPIISIVTKKWENSSNSNFMMKVCCQAKYFACKSHQHPQTTDVCLYITPEFPTRNSMWISASTIKEIQDSSKLTSTQLKMQLIQEH